MPDEAQGLARGGEGGPKAERPRRKGGADWRREERRRCAEEPRGAARSREEGGGVGEEGPESHGHWSWRTATKKRPPQRTGGSPSGRSRPTPLGVLPEAFFPLLFSVGEEGSLTACFVWGPLFFCLSKAPPGGGGASSPSSSCFVSPSPSRSFFPFS